MSYSIYGASVSPYVRKVMVVMKEKGLAFTAVPVNPFDPSEEFLAISPLGKIPALVDESDDRRVEVPDSSVICSYLEHKHPDPPMLPVAPADRARALWLEEYTDSGFVPVVGPGVFQAVVLTQLRGENADVDRANKTLQEETPRFLDYYEHELGDQDFFLGEQMTLADITVASAFVNLGHAGAEVPADRWPKLAGFLQRMHDRESFSSCLAGEEMFHRPADLVW